ncbi:GPP34 family phosphoprotein [Glycomyces sp. TRM65418]|uniref:GPP34 family phosphoprotein n=1 Tax=Glycomyces sp. TRM65418 TaxID=2867006 RepID=UPI001CE65053|nr:GPP34 family phosphoprotein [Glycomyces sp. TRM65418]MCC3761802.1 GPP34 family phosphoprotein [Glycomyces sp. TRM65418]QZD55886.1 GPP34 family phosphoprotein [Glycomyces sp. TRM65418]
MPDAPTPRLIYDAFLITAHHDFYKPAVSPHVSGLGLGAALLAELVISGHLAVHAQGGEDLVFPGPRGQPPQDSLGLWLVELVRSEQDQLAVPQWLEYLAIADVQTKTAEHMVVAGLLLRSERRSRWLQRTQVSYEAADALIAQAPLARMRRQLSTMDQRMPLVDAFLLAVTEAVGLSKPLYSQLPSGARDYADGHLRVLPAPLQTLRGHLIAAVADNAITGNL